MGQMEIWKPVVGFEGLYEVSNNGNVRSIDHYIKCHNGKRKVRGRSLKICDRGNGYAFVTMGKDGKQYNVHVHRAVAEAFIPNPNNLPIINHKDCNPMNPSADNLEWCDHKYNRNYGDCTEKMIAKTSKPVLQIKDGVVVKRWNSLSEIGREKGFHTGNISRCCNGERLHAHEYEWRYE